MIVVVTGLPRSGTSALMGMLAAGGLEVVDDGSRPADANNPRGYFEDHRVKALARDVTWLAEVEGKAIKVVLSLLPSLPTHLDVAVLVLQRDLDEVLASQQRMLERLGRPSQSTTALRQGFAAQRARAEAWLGKRAEDGSALRWTTVSHRRMMIEPAAIAEQVCRFLGLPLDRTAMAASIDQGLYRERS